MQFLDAVFLWAGFAVLIPPIIHLFNFRRYKTVYFSDVRFLQNLRNVTRQRNTLKNILLMVLRMLVIASIVVAFAQPVTISGPKDIAAVKSAPPIIYIDNSFSMQAGELSGLNLENAKNRAIDIVDAFPQETKFLFITNDFSQEHNRLVSRDGIRMFLQKLSMSPNVPSIGQVVNKAVQNLNFLDVEPGSMNNVFVISDFQKNVCDFSSVPHDSLMSINLVPIKANDISNISIDTCMFSAPYRMNGSQEEVTVVLRNFGDKAATNVPIRLTVNGTTKCAQTFDINSDERKEIVLKYTNNDYTVVRGQISINESPIDYDNDLFFTYTLDSLKKILVIGDNPDKKYYIALFGRDKNFQLDVQDITQDIDLSGYQAVILNELPRVPNSLSSKVQNFVAQGGNAIFVPSFDGNIDEYNYLLSSLECNTFVARDTVKCKVGKVNTQSLVLRNTIRNFPENADLPKLNQYFNTTSSSYQGEDIVLESDTYKKIVTANDYRSGKFYVFCTPLNTTAGNLVTHRLIVPILYNAVAISQNYAQQYYTVIGQDDGFPVKLPVMYDGTNVTMKPDNAQGEFVPRVSGPDAFMDYKIFSENCVESSGFYTLLCANSPVNAIAYNYSRKESQLEFVDPADLEQQLKDQGIESVRLIDTDKPTFALQAAESASVHPVWKLFVVLALLFAAAEMAVARFM